MKIDYPMCQAARANLERAERDEVLRLEAERSARGQLLLIIFSFREIIHLRAERDDGMKRDTYRFLSYEDCMSWLNLPPYPEGEEAIYSERGFFQFDYDLREFEAIKAEEERLESIGLTRCVGVDAVDY